MLETLNCDLCSQWLNDKFKVQLDDATTCELQLIEVRSLGDHPLAGDGKGRAPFSLLFVGPQEPSLCQQIYPLEPAEGDRLELFLVPLGPGDEGMLYEAVFT